MTRGDARRARPIDGLFYFGMLRLEMLDVYLAGFVTVCVASAVAAHIIAVRALLGSPSSDTTRRPSSPGG